MVLVYFLIKRMAMSQECKQGAFNVTKKQFEIKYNLVILPLRSLMEPGSGVVSQYEDASSIFC